MVTNPSSFVNSSRERSLSSTSSYPSLRCKLRICCLPCPRWTLRLERPTGCGLYTHTFQMAHTIYGPYGTILFGRFFCCSPTLLLLLLLLPRLTFFVVVFPLVASSHIRSPSPGFFTTFPCGRPERCLLELYLFVLVPFCFVSCFAAQ